MNRARIWSTSDNKVITLLDIENDESVIDIGGRDGFYSKHMLTLTNNITVLDVNDAYFEELQNEGMKTIKADICEYSNGVYDIVFMANVYHDLVNECGLKALQNIQKIVRKKIAILDFKPEVSEFGPPLAIRLDKKRVINDMEKFNFKLVKEEDFISHYFLIFERNK
ncbi:MAG: hypothetical protein BJBARM5_0195 [Candidatus Parvarchaeum acidophilus ARMAN-5]|jgi:hypothetical protein|uniref:Methyltransferase type 11 n=1 Tax=Candidatus Parvarchaeum acidophilus ARMAN-5 TaxID=662762 RepID=D6GUP9_PARA5|nr:MAG: hypothetical protein BJBARM5_0195 [Candidatus Parvarchaeum acidophilus ARMAN-5]